MKARPPPLDRRPPAICARTGTPGPIDGGWVEVRRVGAGNRWYQATDRLAGTDVYGSRSSSAWSINFETAVPGYNQFLFTTGDCRNWLIAGKSAVVGGRYSGAITGNTVFSPECRDCQRPSIRSSVSSSARMVRWWRTRSLETPWISLTDHSAAISQGRILYGENGYGGTHASAVLPRHGGARVFIRRNPAGVGAAWFHGPYTSCVRTRGTGSARRCVVPAGRTGNGWSG